jgi:broad specificity phosphatase PhoE
VQAAATAARFAGVGLSAVHSSDLKRAYRTAEMIAQAAGIPEISVSPALREAHFGTWEGRTIDEIHRDFPREAALWMADSVHYRAEGGESLQEVWERSVAYFTQNLPLQGGQRIAIVSHGGPIKAIICHALAAPLSAFRHIRLDNCSVTTVRYTPADGNLAITGVNDTCHLLTPS